MFLFIAREFLNCMQLTRNYTICSDSHTNWTHITFAPIAYWNWNWKWVVVFSFYISVDHFVVAHFATVLIMHVNCIQLIHAHDTHYNFLFSLIRLRSEGSLQNFSQDSPSFSTHLVEKLIIFFFFEFVGG